MRRIKNSILTPLVKKKPSLSYIESSSRSEGDRDDQQKFAIMFEQNIFKKFYKFCLNKLPREA